MFNPTSHTTAPAPMNAWQFRHRGREFSLVRNGQHEVQLRRHAETGEGVEIFAANDLVSVGRSEFQLGLAIVISAADRVPRERLPAAARALVARFIIRAGHEARSLAA